MGKCLKGKSEVGGEDAMFVCKKCGALTDVKGHVCGPEAVKGGKAKKEKAVKAEVKEKTAKAGKKEKAAKAAKGEGRKAEKAAEKLKKAEKELAKAEKKVEKAREKLEKAKG